MHLLEPRGSCVVDVPSCVVHRDRDRALIVVWGEATTYMLESLGVGLTCWMSGDLVREPYGILAGRKGSVNHSQESKVVNGIIGRACWHWHSQSVDRESGLGEFCLGWRARAGGMGPFWHRHDAWAGRGFQRTGGNVLCGTQLWIC